MKVSVDANSENGIIVVDGELDRDTLHLNLWESLSSDSRGTLKQCKAVSIDLAKVARADTAGLAWVLNAIRDIRKVNAAVTVTNIPKKLIDLAALSNASQLITEQRG